MIRHAILAVAWSASLSTAQVFLPLGDLPGGNTLSECQAVSGDGLVAVGGSIVGGSGFSQVYAAFRADEGVMSTVFNSMDQGGSVVAYGASFDGEVIIGAADYGFFSDLGTQAFIWTRATGPRLIGDLPGGTSGVPRAYARGISDDGMTIVGIGESVRGQEGWVYSVADDTFTPIGGLPGATQSSYAYGVSRDGRVVVGLSNSAQGQEAFAWTRDGGMRGLGFLPGPIRAVYRSEANAANDDGSVIVGESHSAAGAPNGLEAFRWSEQEGMIPLGDLPGGAFASWAYAVSGDGDIVVGRASIQGPCGAFGCGSLSRAFIWTRCEGMRDVQLLLAAAGADLTNWNLSHATGISRDGTTIVGTGTNPQGFIEAWMARLPTTPRCAADLDNGTGQGCPDGGVNIDDLLYFIMKYEAGSVRADLDDGTFTGTRDGGVTIEDLLYFLFRFESGC